MSISGDTLTLSWDDFRGHVPPHATRAAFTYPTFDVKTPFIFSVVRHGHRHVQSDFRLSGVTVTVALNRGEMWSRASARTDDLLLHEQGHYDITAILMRDLDADLTALFASGRTFPSQQQLQQFVDTVQQPIVALHARLQSSVDSQRNHVDGVYDQQTQDGTNAIQQAKWNAAFRAARSSSRSRLAAALAAQQITIP